MKKLTTILLLLILTACGTRKVETSIERSESKEVTKIDTEICADTNIRVSENNESIEVEPIDPTQESTYNGKKFKNAKFKAKKTKKDTEIAQKVVAKKQEISQKEQKTFKKEKKSEVFNWLIIIVILALWFYLSKKM